MKLNDTSFDNNNTTKNYGFYFNHHKTNCDTSDDDKLSKKKLFLSLSRFDNSFEKQYYIKE
jgi:hypothetical protein